MALAHQEAQQLVADGLACRLADRHPSLQPRNGGRNSCRRTAMAAADSRRAAPDAAQGAAARALFGMGVMVALRPMRIITPELPILLLIKLILHPLIVWTLFSAIGGFDRIWVFTAVLMAALPPALNQTYVERASNLILVGTLLSVITVTGLLYLITSGLPPADLLHR
jgi:hypothetical protein